MCPIHNELIDLYKVVIRSAVIIPVERILATFARYESRQIFQEALTQEVAVILGAEVLTVGVHSGIEVISHAP